MLDTITTIGFCGATLSLAAWAMKRTTHMRMFSLASSACTLSYGIAVGAWPVIVLHVGLLPLNAIRLWQLHGVLKAARGAVESSDWLVPHARVRTVADGEPLVRAGEPARRLVLILSGAASCADTVLGPGDFAGDGRPFQPDLTESRTVLACGEATVAVVRLPPLEDYALQDPLLLRRVAHLALERGMRAA